MSTSAKNKLSRVVAFSAEGGKCKIEGGGDLIWKVLSFFHLSVRKFHSSFLCPGVEFLKLLQHV